MVDFYGFHVNVGKYTIPMESMSLEVSCGRSWLNHFLLVGNLTFGGDMR